MTSKSPSIESCFEAENRLRKETPVFTRLAIMQYELGFIARSFVYGETATDKKEKAAHVANALVELADLVTQCHMLLHSTCADFPELKYHPGWEELQADGIERQLTRMQELLKKERGESE